uniref:Aminopeptidase N-like N-terminal domain-containing protein n=1 Tax=Anopheles culicifacies TaxID=139723 RepID=A0A182MWE3_9DIPT
MNNNSKMQIRESLGMEVDGTTVEGNRGYLITRMTLLATAAIFCCLLLGSGLLIYHFASCEEHHTSSLQHATICEHHHSIPHSHQQHPSQAEQPAPADTRSTTTSTHKTLTESTPGGESESVDKLTPGENAANQSRLAMQDTSATDAGVPTYGDTVASSVREDLRLPRSIEPVAYDIRLIPWLVEDNFTFFGTVDILVNVLEDCTNVTLHVAALTIHSASVERVPVEGRETESEIHEGEEAELGNEPSGGSVLQEMIEIDHNLTVSSKQFYVLMLKTSLRRSEQYLIRIKYEGVLNDYLQGFYRSSYTANNETRWIATTQFQPTDARRAFPCFDEPALKARFNISIARTQDMISLSNMPRLRSYEAG